MSAKATSRAIHLKPGNRMTWTHSPKVRARNAGKAVTMRLPAICKEDLAAFGGDLDTAGALIFGALPGAQSFRISTTFGAGLNYAVASSTPDDVDEFDYLYALTPDLLAHERERIIATTPPVTPEMQAMMDEQLKLLPKRSA